MTEQNMFLCIDIHVFHQSFDRVFCHRNRLIVCLFFSILAILNILDVGSTGEKGFPLGPSVALCRTMHNIMDALQ